MSITVTCRCGQSFAARPEHAGRTLPCPVCHQPIAVPVAQEIKLQPLPPQSTSPPKPTSFAPEPPSSGGQNLTLILAIGGGVAVVLLLMCGVAGGIAYYQFSKPRAVAKMPPNFGAPPVQFSQQPNYGPPPGFGPPSGSFSPRPGPYTPPPTATPPYRSQPFTPSGTGSSAFPPAGTSTHTEPGLFSIAIPFGWEMIEEPKQPGGTVDSREFTAKHATKKGHLSVHAIELPNASQSNRKKILESREAFLRETFQQGGHQVVQLQGLDRSNKIPAVVTYTYKFTGRKSGSGEGTIYFTAKRTTVLHGVAFDQPSLEQIRQSLATYREL